MSAVAMALIVVLGPALFRQGERGISAPTGDTAAFTQMTYRCDAESCRQVEGPYVPLTPNPSPGGRGESEGIFTFGEIDLTGNGIAETVELSNGAITILQDGEVAWRSPQEWSVVDLALGDPNHDGRYEILAAFWRDDAEGVPRSQPFIIGYRQGHYRTLWGGSPIAEPIVELALGDVTGDGVEDLIVLEALPPGGVSGPSPHRGEAGRGEPAAVATTIAVWRWHGWGYSRMWRSEEGAYRDLVLQPGTDGAPATIRVTAAPRR